MGEWWIEVICMDSLMVVRFVGYKIGRGASDSFSTYKSGEHAQQTFLRIRTRLLDLSSPIYSDIHRDLSSLPTGIHGRRNVEKGSGDMWMGG